MSRLSFCLIIPLLLAGQPPFPRGPGRPRSGPSQEAQPIPTKPEDLCSLEGQVLNAATGEPLGKAAVTLRRVEVTPGAPGSPRSYTGASNTSGKFSIDNIEPGKYKLSAIRTGFVNAEYGARDFLESGATLPLQAGQRMRDVLFRMTPNGVISGRIVDEDREPIALLQVQAMRYRYSQGRKQLASYGSATTNDIGEYRIFGLPPGRYYLSVSPRRSYSPGGGVRNTAQQPEEEYVATYYPGTTDPSTAAPLDIGPGTQFRGADVPLARRRTVHVKGHVTDASGSERRRPMVFLIPRGLTGFTAMNRPSIIDVNGNFDIRGVTSGSYTLVASLQERGRSLAARMPVEVGNSSVENLSVTINPAVNVSGRVRLEGDAAASVASVQVNLRPRDPSGLIPGSAIPAARVKEDGSFIFSGVNPDHYNVTLSGLADGFYVKAVRFGEQDALGPGLELSNGATGSLDILLAPNAGRVTGVVHDDQQQPAAQVTVVLIPQEKEHKDQPQYYKTVTTDAAGAFTLNNVDPGQYKVYAWREVESGAYMDADFVAPVESRGESLTIREGSQENVQLKLIG